MGATTPEAFDPKPRYLGEVRKFIAGEAILAGQVCAFAASGVTDTVHPATSSLGSPVGVALHSAASGAYVAVAGNGSEVKVMGDATDTAVTAGDFVSVGTVAGCTLVADTATWAHEAEGAGLFVIGQCVEASTAGSGTTGSTCYVYLNMVPPWTKSS